MEPLEQYQQDFLWAAYFGITRTEATREPNKCVDKCIDRAYLDLNRTIHYRLSAAKLAEKKKKTSSDEEKEQAKDFECLKSTFRDEVREYLEGRIESLFSKQEVTEEWFDKEWHKLTCEKIKEIANKNHPDLLESGKPFTFGQSQKWVNMTLKYLLVMNVEGIEGIVGFLHVPIDSYILKAAKKKGMIRETAEVSGLGVSPTFKEPWSSLDEPYEYLEYQKKIRAAMEGVGEECPIFWEGRAWIAQAEEEELS